MCYKIQERTAAEDLKDERQTQEYIEKTEKEVL
jgi:hypothetical protein